MCGLEGKRLLLLGGGQWKDAIKQYADDKGIILLAAGNDPDSGIFSISEKGFIVDSTDGNAITSIIKNEHVDGVYLGGAEPVISAAIRYLPSLGLPVFCNTAQWETLQDKSRFKALCKSHGLPVVPAYDLSGDEADIPPSSYPVVVKPIDGSGSSGMTVCYGRTGLAEAISRAKRHSFSRRCLVERFVKNDDARVLFYSFANGRCTFSGIEDKYIINFKEHGSFIAGLLLFGSSDSEEIRTKFEPAIRNMSKEIGLTEGCLWMEVFRENGEYYFNEAGYRHGGSMSMYPINYYFHVNQVASEIHFSLTGHGNLSVGGSLFREPIIRGKRYAVYPMPMQPGRIARIKGIREVKSMHNVLYVCIRKAQGQFVPDTGSFDQIFALVHFIYDTMSECKATIEQLHQRLHVESTEGHELLVRMISFEERPFKDDCA